MTEDEKKLIQARHRLEAVQARNRQKERKARTRRLIQEGAILESVWPEIDNISIQIAQQIVDVQIVGDKISEKVQTSMAQHKEVPDR